MHKLVLRALKNLVFVLYFISPYKPIRNVIEESSSYEEATNENEAYEDDEQTAFDKIPELSSSKKRIRASKNSTNYASKNSANLSLANVSALSAVNNSVLKNAFVASSTINSPLVSPNRASPLVARPLTRRNRASVKSKASTSVVSNPSTVAATVGTENSQIEDASQPPSYPAPPVYTNMTKILPKHVVNRPPPYTAPTTTTTKTNVSRPLANSATTTRRSTRSSSRIGNISPIPSRSYQSNLNPRQNQVQPSNLSINVPRSSTRNREAEANLARIQRLDREHEARLNLQRIERQAAERHSNSASRSSSSGSENTMSEAQLC